MTTKKLICALCVLAVVEVGYELWLNKNKADQQGAAKNDRSLFNTDIPINEGKYHGKQQ